MSRFTRPGLIVQNITIQFGATDKSGTGCVNVDLMVPSDNATLLEMTLSTKTAQGGDTGTHAVGLAYGIDGAAVAIVTAAQAGLTGTPASAAGTVAKSSKLAARVSGKQGQRLGLYTTKTGTIATGATYILQLVWQG